MEEVAKTTEPIKLNPRFFRPGSSCQSKCVNFVVGDGGIGDYLCYMAAIRWIADNHPQVEGRVYCGEFFIELAENILRGLPRWRVYEKSALTAKKVGSRPTYGPLFRPINCTGAHPLDLGFIYYANMTTPEDGNKYPSLDLSAIASEEPERPYAVMTPGAATPNRTMPAKAFNGIKQHFIDLGITPMFLGKSFITDKRKINFDEGYDYEGGVDLRDKTTLLQAAALMSKAKVVVGLDNGLLHLAGCTEVPIVFGYNIASPEHRAPRRPKGKLRQIYPDPTQLTCTFCQSQMRFMFSHDFAKCVYSDNLCLEALSDPKPWCDLIDDILKEPDDKPLQSEG